MLQVISMLHSLGLSDWATLVDIVTKLTTATTAVVTAILAYRTFLRTPEQASSPDEPTTTDAEGELTEAIVFKTSKQQTTLKVTKRGLECHLQDTRPGRGGHKWTLAKSELKTILETGAFIVNPGYNANAGTFSIGPRR